MFGRTFRTACLLLSCAVLTSCAGEPPEQGAAPAPKTIAFLRAVPTATGQPPFLEELAEAGWVQGRNLTLLGAESSEAYPEEAAAREAIRGWVRQGVDLIVALSTGGATAARDEAPDVPVLFLVNDPTASGLVRNERRPEGRMTGVTFRVPADRTLVTAKRVIPDLSAVGLIYPAEDPAADPHRRAVEQAAGKAGVVVHAEAFTGEADIPRAVQAARSKGAKAIFVSNSPGAIRAREQIRAASQGLPVIANTSVVDFAVVVLQPKIDTVYRQMARQAARLMSGTSPRSVPVEDPRSYETVLNEKAAAELGIRLPADEVREADRVIR